MTILDTFYLLFRTDATGTKKEISDLEKQIDLLTQKGKKRTDAENAALKDATKRHKELTSELKEQTKQTDQLGDSFAKTIEGGVAALTGFATFSGLKSGILDAQQFNRELAIQSKISGQNVTELKAYGAAYESAGGSAEGFLDLVKSATAIAAQAGRPLRDIKALFDYIRNDIRGLPLEQAQFKLQAQYGLPLESLAFFEQSDKDYEKAIKQSYELAQATEEDARKADDFGKAWSHVSQALQTDFTHLGSDLFPNLTQGMEDSAHSLTDLTKTKGGVEELFAAVAIGAPIATALLTKLAISAAGWAAALSKAVIPLTLFLEAGQGAGDVFAGNTGNRQSLIGKGAGVVSEKILDWWYGPVQKAAPAKEPKYTSEKQQQLGELYGATPENSTAADLAQYSANKTNIAAMQAEIASIKSVLAAQPEAGGVDKTLNVKIDEIHVNTQATDAAGVAQGIGSGLQNEFRNAIGNWDDGVQY